MYRWRCVTFEDWQAKAAYLDGAAWLDARLPFVRDVARRFAVAASPNNGAALADFAFRFVRDRIRYVRDPASEEFSDGQQVLLQGYGDCDDKARLLVALARSIGVEARIRPVVEQTPWGEHFAHVQAELRWPGSGRFAKAKAGGWVTAEVILQDAQLGDETGEVPTRLLA